VRFRTARRLRHRPAMRAQQVECEWGDVQLSGPFRGVGVNPRSENSWHRESAGLNAVPGGDREHHPCPTPGKGRVGSDALILRLSAARSSCKPHTYICRGTRRIESRNREADDSARASHSTKIKSSRWVRRAHSRPSRPVPPTVGEALTSANAADLSRLQPPTTAGRTLNQRVGGSSPSRRTIVMSRDIFATCLAS
jgi:hypothetical protein